MYKSREDYLKDIEEKLSEAEIIDKEVITLDDLKNLGKYDMLTTQGLYTTVTVRRLIYIKNYLIQFLMIETYI